MTAPAPGSAAALVVLATAQAGAFHRRQAAAAGWSNRRLALAVRDAELRLRHPGVFVRAAAHGPATEDWAAYLGGGRGAVLAGFSAARALGWGWDGPPAVLLPQARHLRLGGVRMLRWELSDDEDLRMDPAGRLVTVPVRTVVDCLRLAASARRERLLDQALLAGLISVDELDAQVTALARRPGVEQLRGLLRGVSEGARSRAERDAMRLLRGSGVTGWAFNVPVVLPGGQRVVLDAAVAALRLAVEIDGRAYHVGVDRFQRDRSRQNALVRAGWTVLRFTWTDLQQRPDLVRRTVRETARRLAA